MSQHPLLAALAIAAVSSACALHLEVAHAQGTAKPDTLACPANLAAIATCYGARLPSGAYVLAAMPKKWNGDLVVFAHGGPYIVPPQATTGLADLEKYAVTVKLGYGWVGSTYRREGYGVRMAVSDTEDARRFFIERVAQPRRVLLHGASYGGLVGAKLLETESAHYAGAFLNSGVVGGALRNYEFRADLRVVYQYYCKNLPRPDEAQYPLWTGLPPASTMTLKEVATRVDECTGIEHQAAERSEMQKQQLADILGVIRIPENMLVRHMQAATYVLRDLAQGIGQGRSVFSNRSVHYRGSHDDAALNREVERFDADPAALAALTADGLPTGAAPVPVLSIHSMNDPQAAVEAQYEYRARVQAAGNDTHLAQAYTDEVGHTAQSAPELAAAFEALAQWLDQGVKPTPALLEQGCERLRATFEGVCSYRPGYEPRPYNTRYARAAR